MNEKLLQYIWQHQYFNLSQLVTTAGERLKIVHPGHLNKAQGPDFLDARIRIGETLFAGSVELHMKTSLWAVHGHERDPNYGNVILHVVYEHDMADNGIPVLELQPRIPGVLTERYARLMNNADFIACARQGSTVSELIWTSWKGRLLVERLTRKATVVTALLRQNAFHWEQVFWWMLARNFGMRTNVEAFGEIARSISLSILGRHRNQIHQIEALLFGQARLLDFNFREEYPRMLQREYRFLKKKYSLCPISLPIHFLRIRPGNFPTVRLAQLAMLVKHSNHLFRTMLDTAVGEPQRRLFDVTANDYWHYHYRFDEPAPFKKKKLGASMIDNILINTVAPMLFAYGTYKKEESYRKKAVECLEQLNAEQNSLTRGFESIGVTCTSAFDSQALLELKSQYCDGRYCLRCAVGNAILRTT